MADDKKITIVEVTDRGAETRTEPPKPKVKASALGLSPEDVERMIKVKQEKKA